ncbi:hypothetical protein R6Q57_024503 [Mikania cordata]
MTSTGVSRPSRRSPSLSSSSSSSVGSLSTFFLDGSSSPATPLQYSGIPFSWEQFPGIPKKNDASKASSQCLLPPPPSGHSFRKSFGKDSAPLIKKYTSSGAGGLHHLISFHEDPFFAAFVECSKDEDMVIKGSKIRSSGGFGGLYGSCFGACDVAAGSIVYLPRTRSGFLLR